jgi:hypothetical protein
MALKNNVTQIVRLVDKKKEYNLLRST